MPAFGGEAEELRDPVQKQHSACTEKGRSTRSRGAAPQAPLVVAVSSKAAPHPKIPEWEGQVLFGGAMPP